MVYYLCSFTNTVITYILGNYLEENRICITILLRYVFTLNIDNFFQTNGWWCEELRSNVL